jgi:hypothetical protein
MLPQAPLPLPLSDPAGSKPYFLTQFTSLVNSLDIPQHARNNMIGESHQMMGKEIEKWIIQLEHYKAQDPKVIRLIGERYNTE